LPLRGKILNVQKAGSTRFSPTRNPDDHHGDRHGRGRGFKIDEARYHKIIIMTDADVDGATSARCCSRSFTRR